MRGAEFIGLDAINENLKDFRFDAIGVFHGKFEKFKRIAMEDENEEDLIEAFNNWANRMIASNPSNASAYAIQLYDMPEGGKKLQGTSSFTFALGTKQVQQAPMDQYKTNGDFISKKEFERILELERSKIHLEHECNRLEQQLIEQQEEEEEEEEVGMVGAVQDAVISRLPQLMDMMIMQFSKPQTTPMVGIGGSVDEIISEFRMINPDIESDLAKLLNLAKTKPDLFKMLIGQLRVM